MELQSKIIYDSSRTEIGEVNERADTIIKKQKEEAEEYGKKNMRLYRSNEISNKQIEKLKNELHTKELECR